MQMIDLRKDVRDGVIRFLAAGMLILVMLMAFALSGYAADKPEIPAKGIVTMIDLGADKCVPCKMMAPILEKVKKDYEGKALIHFYDVWKDREPAVRYKIRAIPTQIFFDKEGKEVNRHEGYMSEADIVSMLKKLGVK
ncbi:MAG: thioredoxin domain-containing protein [Desulfatirhabdiaceae bacterium]